MENLFDRLVRLLGASIDEQQLKQLGYELGEQPSKRNIGPNNDCFTFPKSGFSFFSLETNLFALLIHLNPIDTSYGDVTPYEGTLPSGIRRNDSIDAVGRKLATSPHQSVHVMGKYRKKEYRIDSQILIFDFHEPSSQLVSLTVLLDPTTQQ